MRTDMHVIVQCYPPCNLALSFASYTHFNVNNTNHQKNGKILNSNFV